MNHRSRARTVAIPLFAVLFVVVGYASVSVLPSFAADPTTKCKNTVVSLNEDFCSFLAVGDIQCSGSCGGCVAGDRWELHDPNNLLCWAIMQDTGTCCMSTDHPKPVERYKPNPPPPSN